MNTGNDVHAFATALQRGGYATDPNYANKLVSLAEQLGLRQPVAAVQSTSLKTDVAAPIADHEGIAVQDADRVERHR